MAKQRMGWALAGMVAMAGLAGGVGCELIAAVDRNLITAGDGGGGAGGAGGDGGQAGDGGSGGSGCTAASDCPGVDTTCSTRTCESGMCGVVYAAQGTLVPGQVIGDCQASVCDGNGDVESVADDMDPPGEDGNQCTIEGCAGGMAMSLPAPLGAPCTIGGQVCDGAGACVECNSGEDCASGICTGHVCEAATCTDMVKNGNETDVDCGGVDCPPCDTGEACVMDADCTSVVCINGVCQAPTCNDGVQNGDETNVDCGGPVCPPCP